MKTTVFIVIIILIIFLPQIYAMPDMNTDELKDQIEKRIRDVRAQNIHAPEFISDTKWINLNGSLSIERLRGKIVLLDFWTYCCINCIHVITDVNYLEQKYAHAAFEVVGVHSPKFTNEQDYENVRHAVLRYGIEHPVVLDNDHRVWSAYGVRAWLSFVLIDPEGYVIGYFFGEGNRNILDKHIEIALDIYGETGKLATKSIPRHPERRTTADLPLSYPDKICAHPAKKQLIISDSNHNRIIVVDTNGEVLDIIGSGEAGFSDGNFQNATFNHPRGVAFYKDLLLVADTENHAIRQIDFQQRQVVTIAGNGKQARSINKYGDAKKTALNSPWDVFVQDDVCYIAMAGAHQIWSYELITGTVAPYAGTGREGKNDGSRLNTAFAQPSGITGDGQNLYVADSENSSIRKIDTINGTVTSMTGGDLNEYGDRDGVGNAVRLQHPMGVTFYNNVLYVADSYNHKVKTINPNTNECVSYRGCNKGFRDGTTPKFYKPSGLVGLEEKLYISDSNNHRIRILDLETHRVATLMLTGLKIYKKEKPLLATHPSTETKILPQ